MIAAADYRRLPFAMTHITGIRAAYEEASKGYGEGGIPIGSVILNQNGEILGRGHNQRIQKSSPTLHAEIAALENAGRQKADVYRTATLVRRCFRLFPPPRSSAHSVQYTTLR